MFMVVVGDLTVGSHNGRDKVARERVGASLIGSISGARSTAQLNMIVHHHSKTLVGGLVEVRAWVWCGYVYSIYSLTKLTRANDDIGVGPCHGGHAGHDDLFVCFVMLEKNPHCSHITMMMINGKCVWNIYPAFVLSQAAPMAAVTRPRAGWRGWVCGQREGAMVMMMMALLLQLHGNPCVA